MKTVISSLALFFLLTLSTYAQITLYTASKAGLNMREKADVNASVLTKIPYGEKVEFIRNEGEAAVETEGMKFSWIYISYQGKKGYVADIYTLPFAPPKHKDVETYLNATFTKIGKWESKPEFEAEGAVHDNVVQTEKILYSNGILYRINLGYEWHNISVWLPGFTMQQAFVLARLLPDFGSVISTTYPFPSTSQKYANGADVTVFHSESWPFTQTIRYEFCNGACHTVEIRNEDGEISLIYSSGI